MIDSLLNRVIGSLKGDRVYRIRTRYSTREILNVLFYRSCQVLRGLLKGIRLGRGAWPMFCGRRVVIEHSYNVHAGRSVILEDGVFINALSDNGIKLGRNVTIGRGAILTCTGVIAWRGVGITIGDNSAVGAQSFLGGQGGIVIGKDVIMGPGVRIFSEDHKFDKQDTAIRNQGERRSGVTIGDNCWIGAGVTIVDGVQLAPGCVVAAGAVVTKSAPLNSLLGGVPASVIRSRI